MDFLNQRDRDYCIRMISSRLSVTKTSSGDNFNLGDLNPLFLRQEFLFRWNDSLLISLLAGNLALETGSTTTASATTVSSN